MSVSATATAYVYEAGNGYGIIWDADAFVCTLSRNVAATAEASFPPTESGLACAIAWIDYRVRRESKAPAPANREERRARLLELEAQAARIFAMGRRKAHEAWLDA